MKRTLSLLLVLCLLLSMVTAAFAEEAEPAPEEAAAAAEEAEAADEEAEAPAEEDEAADEADEVSHTYDVVSVPLYIADADSQLYEEFPLTFFDDVDDMPWIPVELMTELVNTVMQIAYKQQDFNLQFFQEGSTATVVRENDYSMEVDYDADTITFSDYNGFLCKPGQERLMDMLSYSGFNESGEAELFQRDNEASFDRYGHYVTLELADYDIDLIEVEDMGFIPLQTVNDFLLSPLTGRAALFNGQAIFLINSRDLVGEDGPSPLAEMYFGAGPAERSEAFAEFGFNELSLMLDYQYGLKDNHGIDSFRDMFRQIGLKDDLMSTDPAKADQALHDFLSFYLDDVHTYYNFASWMTGPGNFERKNGISRTFNDDQENAYKELRAQVMGGLVDYQEVGNTAYITFDEFSSDFTPEEYYDSVNADDYLPDTIGLMIAARRAIYREGSPVENVVLDLTCNTGGAADAALFVISWIMGQAEVSVEDACTGAQSTLVYRADVNMDHVFDDQDTLKDKHVYILISPVSFSCGNLVPSVCKTHQAITLIGRTSGGGACTVQAMSSAWGSTFAISGNNRLSFRRNGSFYDIDEGVDPDIYIDRLETLYDREALTDLINNLH